MPRLPAQPCPLRALLSLLLLLGSASLPAADSIQLLPYDASWRYDESGTFPDPRWMESAYVDSDWKSGPGVFVAPASESLGNLATIGTKLHDGNRLPQGHRVHLFRTHFNFDRDPAGAVLIASNLLDDGAIFYLNGQEVGRTNVIRSGPEGEGTPTGDVSSTGAQTLRFSSANLKRGKNLMAVELHQTGFFSSDAVFGMNLWAEFLTTGEPLVTSTATNIQGFAPDEILLAFEVLGDLPRTYQWLKNDQPLPDGTNLTHRIPSASQTDSGTYTLRVQNARGQTVSSNALVTVQPAGAVPLNHPWRAHMDGSFPGEDWTRLEYNDAHWTTIRTPIANENTEDNRPPPRAVQTHLDHLAPLTTYFRTSFDWDQPATRLALVFTLILDDGVVVHLNGNETLRVRMPENQVNQFSGAVRQVLLPKYETFAVPADHLVQGRNIVAAEVHQYGEHSRDMMFALRLSPEPLASIPTNQLAKLPPPSPPATHPTEAAHANARRIPLVEWADEWSYRLASGQDDGRWRQAEDGASGWERGRGVFVRETGELDKQWPEGTAILDDASTIWLRTTFHLPNADLRDLAALELQCLVDDGAVFHLNGVECHRFNMPHGPADTRTRSRVRVTTVDLSGPVRLPGSLLVGGTNHLAVSLHRAAVMDRDLTFGCRLELLVPNPPAPPKNTLFPSNQP